MSLNDFLKDANTFGIAFITGTVTASSVYYIFTQMHWPNIPEVTVIMFIFAFFQAWGKSEL